jgi:glycosyltransferase involved in cell wall biosynthesis
MQILHVIASMDPKYGGPSQGIRNLEVGMNGRNIVREVVCFDDPGSKYLGADNFKVHALGEGKGVWHYSNGLVPWLTNNLQRFDVIINGLWQYYSYATWKVIDKQKKRYPGSKIPKLLVMPHGMLDPYFQRATNRKAKALRNWFYWKLIERNVVNGADGLLFTCETELLLARQTFVPYNPREEYNVGYGIEAPPEYNKEMSNAFLSFCPDLKSAPYILFLSRLHTKKGVDILIDAYISLHGTIAEELIPNLVIAGPGLETSYGRSLRDKIPSRSKIKNKIFFTGMLTDNSKWGAFYGCEAFILPSHQENFGIAVVEALACSKPVLISNQVNIWREIVGEGGGIVEADNKEAVKKLLEKWVKLTRPEKTKMGANALLAYKKHFSVEQIVQNYTEVFANEA